MSGAAGVAWRQMIKKKQEKKGKSGSDFLLSYLLRPELFNATYESCHNKQLTL